MSNHTLFISDLHLDLSRPDLSALFFHFLQTHAPQSDAVYILGDFFEAWIGDDVQSALHKKVSTALRQLTENGTPVYLMRGNRDVLLGQRYAEQCGAQLLPDPSVIHLYGQPVLLMHGDSLCTLDTSHMRFRMFSTHAFCQRLFLTLPGVLRRAIARRLRQVSQRHNRKVQPNIVDVTPEAVDAAMHRHQVTQLIHGHTHHAGIHHFSLGDGNETAATRYVLGAWTAQEGNALIYRSDGSSELMAIRD